MKTLLKESLFDLVVITLALATAGVSGYLLNDSNFIFQLAGVQPEASDVIGEIYEIENDVRRRSPKSILWQPLSRKENVFEGDSVFTGKESGATVSLNSGDSLSISPNSVVLIETEDGLLNLDLQIGSVIAKLRKNQSLRIRQNNEVIDLKSTGSDSTVNIVKGKKKIRMKSIKGQARISSKGKSVDLSKDKIIEVSKAKSIEEAKPNVFPIQPVQSSVVWPKQGSNVSFLWRSDKSSKGKLQITKRSDFVVLGGNHEIALAQGAYTQELKPGTYWWQIVGSKGEMLSEPEKFHVASTRPPRALYPMLDEHLYASSRPNELADFPVEFIWKPNKYADQYEVEVSPNEKFDIDVKRWVVTTSSTTQKLKGGNYFWRVNSQHKGSKTPWSRTIRFKVGPEIQEVIPEPPIVEVEPPTPKPTPKPKKVRKVASKPKWVPIEKPEINPISDLKVKVERPELIEKQIVPFTFKWSERERAKGYKVQMSRDEKFETLLVDKVVKTNELSTDLQENGPYYVRVAPMKNRKKRGGPFSKPTAIELEKFFRLKVPKMVSNPNKDIKVVKLGGSNDDDATPVIFVWKKVKYASRYQIQFSTKQDFKKPFHTETLADTNYLLTRTLPNTTIYWRIRAESDKFTSKWSKLNEF